VALPQHQTLVVRPVEPTDVEGLMALYEGLDRDARYRRFFSVYRPPRSFFERLVSVGERGGAGLVAVHRAGASDERIVAEASYEHQPDGDGEVGITVDAAWRGWLGPYLLDALAEEAAARGVPNLVADVLVTNGPMLALFRSRGCVLVPNEDFSVVRAKIGTASAPATWPAVNRRRVLVEGAGGQWHAAQALRAAGLDVLVCPGPGPGRSRCPALAGVPCPLAAEADAIVVARPPDEERWDALRRTHPRLHPGVPVCVELRTPGGALWPEEEEVPPDRDASVAAIEDVARSHPRHRIGGSA
jgi:ribosomal protein S18 acetylase RimI-like enzyme